MLKKIQKGVYLDKKNNKIIKYAYSYKIDENLIKEYNNYLKINKIKLKAKIKFPKTPVLSKDKKSMTLEFINGTNLKNIKDPKIYEQFGKELKKMHEEGIIHSHLEIQDVIYQKKVFYLVDLLCMNEFKPLNDYARIKISIHLMQFKKPWTYFKYKQLSKAFSKGYSPNKKTSEKYTIQELTSISDYYIKKGTLINKIRSFIIKNIIKKLIVY